MKHELKITQDMRGYYTAYIEIEAETREEAISIAEKLSQNDLNALAYDWELGYNDELIDGTIKLDEV